MKFLITGGGICGLTTAIALHRQGIEVAIYEAAKEIKAVGSGINLSSNAIRAFAAIGLEEVVLAHSKAQAGGNFFTPKGQLLNHTDLRPLAEKFGVPGLVSIHRADLHQVLLEAIKAKIPFYTSTRGQRIEQHKNGIQLHFSDGTSAKGDYLLACDGIHSAIRKQLLPKVIPQFAGYTVWRGLFTDEEKQIPLDLAFKTWGKEGQFGAVPMNKNRVYWFASFKTRYKDPSIKDITIADLRKRFASYHAPIPQILARSKDENLLTNEVEEMPSISNFAFGRILLMGDAAHAMSPNLGQGACQAIEDAAILGKLLASEPTPEQAFIAFEQQRMPRTNRAILDSRNVGKAAHLENRLLIALRNFYLRRTADSAFKKQVDFLNAIRF